MNLTPNERRHQSIDTMRGTLSELEVASSVEARREAVDRLRAELDDWDAPA